ncbi:MAG: N-6 DNA methylase [Thermoplasmatales archaeon]|nr:N-6 DNA methylase [Thermoplasmatales archaeon]
MVKMALSMDEIKQMIDDAVINAKEANTHQAKMMVLSRFLEELFGIKLVELIPGIEKALRSKVMGVRGKADLIFSDIVFEMKVDLEREFDDAKRQIKKYLQALYEIDPSEKNIGIITDAIEFEAYLPIIEDNQVVDLRKISHLNLEEESPEEVFKWFDSFLFSRSQIKPSAHDLKARFGPGSPTYHLIVDELEKLWNKLGDREDIRLKFDLWRKNMEIVYGSEPKTESFIDNTYLVTLVKIIVYLKLNDGASSLDDIPQVLSGEYFDLYGIENLTEEDFFTWILDPKIKNKAIKLARDLTMELKIYNFADIDEDFFKEIYEEIIGRGQRHRIGEYYTPEWLAELTLIEAIKAWKKHNSGFPRILDPACGSGTFLTNAIQIMKKTIREDPEGLLSFILDNIVGVDVNPLAVVIARANYLIALGDLIKYRKGEINIPVYVADSIKMPKAQISIVEGGKGQGTLEVYEVSADDARLRIPKDIFIKKSLFNKIFEAIKKAIDEYRRSRNKRDALRTFERNMPSIPENEFRSLESTFKTIINLIDQEKDSIWVFILKNFYAPIMFSESKFDIIVGNPPWIAMRYIENKKYQEFVKKKILNAGLLTSQDTELFTHMEMATLFFSEASKSYLKENGVISFVMPRSVLTGAEQHKRFQRFEFKPSMKLLRIFDLEDVKPLFNVPSCVLVALKEKKTEYPVPLIKFEGKLPKKNIKLTEAEHYLSFKKDQYYPLVLSGKKSWYYERFKQGATIVPRPFWFIDFISHPRFGIDPRKPFCRSSEDALKNQKKDWGSIKGKVEEKFIYATLLSKDLLPFGYFKLSPVVLPIIPTSRGYEILDTNALRDRGYSQMAQWLEKAQKSWISNATERNLKEHPRVITYLNYRNKLSSQNPEAKHIVLYNSSGTNIYSCVINTSEIEKLKFNKKIKPSGFVVDYTSYFYATSSETEAHYINAIFNSNVLNELKKPLQARGSYGERHISRTHLMFPIPRFDERNGVHKKLALLSKKCHEELNRIKSGLDVKGVSWQLRDKIREKYLGGYIREIDELILESKILE